MELGFSKRDIFAFTLIAIAAFLLLSIFTYDVRDPSFNNAVHSSQAAAATHNTVGIIGSYTSDVVSGTYPDQRYPKQDFQKI